MKIRVLITFLVSVGSIGAITAQEEAEPTQPGRPTPDRPILPPECALALCARPDCSNDEFFTPPGQCCPICRPDCTAVLCERPGCEEGEISVTPPGKCCPVCKTDCSAVSCARPLCKEGEILETPPSQCCPRCRPTRPDCAAVLCLALTEEDCGEGEVLVTPPGECCARCQRDCSVVSCLKPECPEGQTLTVPEGECCPICVDRCPFEGQEFSFCPGGCGSTCIDAINEEFRFCPAVCRPGCGCPRGELIDTIAGRCAPREKCTNPCALVDCAPGFTCKVNRTTNEASCVGECDLELCVKPECEEGETVEVPPGQCCPICTRPDCAAVLCLALTEDDCGEGEVLVTPPGECCARCQRDCSAVSCLKPECEEGEMLQVPEGECCPVCVERCPYEGQEFSFCPGCDSTCIDAINEETRFCPAVCRPGCGCPGGQLIDTIAGRCVPRNKCTNPCALVDCFPRSMCKVNRTTGRPFCTPVSCDVNNGGCLRDEICRERPVVCVTTPCPPGPQIQCLSREVVCSLDSDVGPCEALFPRFFHNDTTGQCEPFTYGGCEGNANNFETLRECQKACGVREPCATVRCRRGHRCEVFEPTGEPFCTPDCNLDNGGCSSAELCTTNTVQCIRAPCPPVVQCLSRCATVRCRAGHECKIYEPTGEPFCAPNCTLGNGGCREHEICTTEDVDCVRAPCPQVAKCLSPCARVRCPGFQRCEVFEPTGEPYCTPDCSIGNGGCAPNEICTIDDDVLCIRAPCTPIVRCERRDPCATHRCRPGHRCEVFEPTGEPFCTPDCSLDNGGCRSDQLCELVPSSVRCVRAPCPATEVQCSCPPRCSREFCTRNPKGLCSNPGPRELPGCTGGCQLTFCKACFYSRDEVNVPAAIDICPVCEDPGDYSKPSLCYWRWSRCAGHLYWRANRPNRRLGEYSTEFIRCPTPPCPFRG